MNNEVEKKVYLSALFEIYSMLLTSKQRDYFNLYINEDYSLNEIADNFNVSRSAVYDSIRLATNALEKFEKNLNNFKNYQIINNVILECENNNEIQREDILRMLKEI